MTISSLIGVFVAFRLVAVGVSVKYDNGDDMEILNKYKKLWSGDNQTDQMGSALSELSKIYPDLIDEALITYYGRDVRIQLNDGRIIRLRGMAAKLNGLDSYEEILAALQNAIADHIELPIAQVGQSQSDDGADSSSSNDNLFSYGFLAAGGALLANSNSTSTAPQFYAGGVVVDDPISGAQLYLEKGDGTLQELKGVVTSEDGRFSFQHNPNNTGLNIVAKGGVNTATGSSNMVTLKTKASSTVINPLTTVLVEIADKSGLSIEEAEAKLLSAFEISLPDGETLLTYEPSKIYAQTDWSIVAEARREAGLDSSFPVGLGNWPYEIGTNLLDDSLEQFDSLRLEPSQEDLALQKLSSTLMLITGEVAQLDEIAAETFIELLATHLSKGQRNIDLANQEFLEGLMIGLNEEASSELIASVLPVINRISGALTFEEITSMQRAFLDPGEPASPLIMIDDSSGAFTIDTGASFVVSFDGVDLSELDFASSFSAASNEEAGTSRYEPKHGVFAGGEVMNVRATLTDVLGRMSETVSEETSITDITASDLSTDTSDIVNVDAGTAAFDDEPYYLVINGISYFDSETDPAHENDLGYLDNSVDFIELEIAINEFDTDSSFDLIIDGKVVATDSPTQQEIDAGVMTIEAEIEEQVTDPNWSVTVKAVDESSVEHSADEYVTWG